MVLRVIKKAKKIIFMFFVNLALSLCFEGNFKNTILMNILLLISELLYEYYFYRVNQTTQDRHES